MNQCFSGTVGIWKKSGRFTMRFGKILLMGLMAACLMGASSRAWDEGNTICPGDGGAEAEQIRIFIKNWKKVYPMDGEPVREFAVTDLDGNGLLEILVRSPESEDIPVVYEVTPDHDGLKKRNKEWYSRQISGQSIAWFVMHPETAAGPWTGNIDDAEAMLQDSYDVNTGRKEAFG